MCTILVSQVVLEMNRTLPFCEKVWAVFFTDQNHPQQRLPLPGPRSTSQNFNFSVTPQGLDQAPVIGSGTRSFSDVVLPGPQPKANLIQWIRSVFLVKNPEKYIEIFILSAVVPVCLGCD